MDIPTDLWGQIALEGASVYINDNTRFTTVRSQEEKFCLEVFSLLGLSLGGVDQEDSYYTHKYQGRFCVLLCQLWLLFSSLYSPDVCFVL